MRNLNIKRHASFGMMLLVLLTAKTIWADPPVRSKPNRMAGVSIETKLDNKAAPLAAYLKSQSQTEVKVDVKGMRGLPIRSTIKQVLVSTLSSNGLNVPKINPSANTLVATLTESTQDQAWGYSVNFKLIDPDDNEVGGINLSEYDIDRRDEPEDIAPDLNLKLDNSDIKTGTSDPIEREDMQVAIAELKKPNPANPDDITNNIARAKPNGMFGLQVLSSGSVCDLELDKGSGLALVNFEEGQDTYEVRVVNDAPFDVLVKLKIDGIDSGWFKAKKQVLWYCPANKTTTISGWLQEGNASGKKFELVPPSMSVAAVYGSFGDIGAIQATFYRAYNMNDVISKVDEKDKIKGRATGEGDKFDWPVKSIEKKPGPKIRAQVVVRYERE